MKKIFSLILVIAVFSLYSGVYAADSIVVKLPDNSYYDASQYIEFDENTTVYPESEKSMLNSTANPASAVTVLNPTVYSAPTETAVNPAVYSTPATAAAATATTTTTTTTTTATTTAVSNPVVPETKTNNLLKASVIKISKGTSFHVFMQEAIDTAYAEVGEDISAMVKNDYIVNGSIIIPQGSLIKGKIVSARPAGKLGRNGKVSILFDRLELPEGEVYNITTEKIVFDVSESGKVCSMALLGSLAIGGGATAGAALSGKSLATGTGAIIGAAVLGLVFLGYVFTTEGKNAVIPQYTEISIVLQDSLDIEETGKY